MGGSGVGSNAASDSTRILDRAAAAAAAACAACAGVGPNAAAVVVVGVLPLGLPVRLVAEVVVVVLLFVPLERLDDNEEATISGWDTAAFVTFVFFTVASSLTGTKS